MHKSFKGLLRDSMNDIQNRKDVETLVDRFYKQVVKDELIAVFFTKVVVLDWKVHISIMYNFWESILFGKATYKGNAMLKHILLNQKMPLKEEHFERWLMLWGHTIDENFKGEKAEEAKQKAKQIGDLMKFKVGQFS